MMCDFNPDPYMLREAERYAAECERRDAEYADALHDSLDLSPNGIDPFDLADALWPDGIDFDADDFGANDPDIEF